MTEWYTLIMFCLNHTHNGKKGWGNSALSKYILYCNSVVITTDNNSFNVSTQVSWIYRSLLFGNKLSPTLSLFTLVSTVNFKVFCNSTKSIVYSIVIEKLEVKCVGTF